MSRSLDCIKDWACFVHCKKCVKYWKKFWELKNAFSIGTLSIKSNALTLPVCHQHWNEWIHHLFNHNSKIRCTNGVSANYYGSPAFELSFLRIFLWVFKYFWTGGKGSVPELSDRINHASFKRWITSRNFCQRLSKGF